MKRTIKNLAIVVLVTFFASSFTTIDDNKKEIKTDKSKLVWKGYKVTGSHEGTLSIKSGSLVFDNDKLTGGEFVIDMTTISILKENEINAGLFLIENETIKLHIVLFFENKKVALASKKNMVHLLLRQIIL